MRKVLLLKFLDDNVNMAMIFFMRNVQYAIYTNLLWGILDDKREILHNRHVLRKTPTFSKDIIGVSSISFPSQKNIFFFYFIPEDIYN